MTTHFLVVTLALIASATYLGARLISLVPQYDDDDDMTEEEVNEMVDAQDAAFDEAAQGDGIHCNSMAEVAAVISTRLPAGSHVEIHHHECEKNDGMACDCESYEFVVAEKATS